MTIVAEDLPERVSQIIPRYSMLAPGSRVGVAVSGGADSVVLLHVLHRLVGDLAIRLTVLHVNHQLRGRDSDEDEQFVRELALKYGLPVVTKRAAPRPGNLEEEARRVRREFFQDCRQRYQLDRVALGHTKSDQAETVLFRLLRGSGLAGLAGMRAVTADGLVRPLLCVSRSEVRAWAKKADIVWREDSSNADETFARNTIRKKVIPDLASRFNPNLENVLAGAADLAAAEEDYWDDHIRTLYNNTAKQCGLGVIFGVEVIAAEHLAVQRRLIRYALCQVRGNLRSIDQQHVEAVLRICQSGHGHDRVLIPGVDVIRSFKRLLLAKRGQLSVEPRNYSIDLTFGQRVPLPFNSGEIELRVVHSDDTDCDNFKKESQYSKESADFDLNALSSSAIQLQVRNWRPGDEMLRPGHQKPEKIKSLFQEFHVLLWQRRHWPVAVVNDQIFWARTFGPASPYKAPPGSTTLARLNYWPGERILEL